MCFPLIFLCFFFIACFGSDDHGCNDTNTNRLNNLTIRIRADSYPSEIDFYIEDSLGSILWSNNKPFSIYEILSDSCCVEDGCYTVNVTDSYGDGIYGGSGWSNPAFYQILLNGELIIPTDKQYYYGYETSLYFCTKLFEVDTNNIWVTLTLRSEIRFASFTFINITDITNGNESSSIVYQNLNFITHGNAITFYLRKGSYKMIANYENDMFETIIDNNQTWEVTDAPTLSPTSAPTSSVNYI